MFKNSSPDNLCKSSRCCLWFEFAICAYEACIKIYIKILQQVHSYLYKSLDSQIAMHPVVLIIALRPYPHFSLPVSAPAPAAPSSRLPAVAGSSRHFWPPLSAAAARGTFVLLSWRRREEDFTLQSQGVLWLGRDGASILLASCHSVLTAILSGLQKLC